MCVQGIRSFGPEDQDRGIIQFFNPLTLILGPNGTGKTTIIESLTYITCGEMPPGAKKGGMFVHDPKVAGESEVRGQIRLQMRDVNGQTLVVCRSLISQQKAKQITCTTVEGTITRMMANNERRDISSKCAEINAEMSASLGVSKAILTNVIFCHQEESNWPLSDGKTLKTKFDEIFNATRYIKAMENIVKTKKILQVENKLHESEIKHLKHYKDRAKEITENMKSAEVRVTACKDAIKQVKEKLKPVDEKLEEICARANEIYTLNTKIEKLHSEMKQLKKSEEKLRENIEREFQGGTDELKQMLADFQNKVHERQALLKQLERQLQRLDEECKEIANNRSHLLVEKGRLETEKKSHDERVAARDDLVRKTSDIYDLEVVPVNTQLNTSQLQRFSSALRDKMAATAEECRHVKAEFEALEMELQAKIDSYRDTKSRLEQTERMKGEDMKKNSLEMQELKKQLQRVDASANKLDQLQVDIRSNECELEQAEKSLDITEVKNDIQTLQADKQRLDQQNNALGEEMNKLHLQSSTRTQLDMQRKERVGKEEQIRRLKEKHSEGLTQLLGHVPGENLSQELDAYMRTRGEEIQSYQRKVQSNRVDMSSYEMNRKSIREMMDKKEKSLKDFEEELREACGSEGIDAGMKSLKESIDKLQGYKGVSEGVAVIYGKFIQKLRQPDPSCPTCHRAFDTTQEVEDLIVELNERLAQVPIKAQQQSEQLKVSERRYQKLVQLLPKKAEMEQLQSEDIPDMRQKLKGATDKLNRLRTSIEKDEGTLVMLQDEEQMAREMQRDVAFIDRYRSEVKEIDRKIASLAANLPGGAAGRSMQDVHKEKQELQLKVEHMSRTLELRRQQLAEHSDNLQQLRATLNELRAEKVEISSNLQRRVQMEERFAELETNNRTFAKEIQEAREQKRPLEERIEEMAREKREKTRLKEDAMQQGNAEVEKMEVRLREVKKIGMEVERYLREGGETSLRDLEDRVKALDGRMGNKEKERGTAKEKFDRIQKDLSTQQIRERELNDNLLLRECETEMKDVERTIERYKKELGGFKTDSIQREKERLVAEKDKLTTEMHVAEGRLRGYVDEIDRYSKELRTKEYKMADDNYLDMLIKKETTCLSIQDLDKYNRVLDMAVMRYHSKKMEEINALVRDMWRHTYRGNDIEYIEIRSDEDMGSSTATRKSYNYRVVMVRGDVALDMRGRCSAGQKVLASIVIRLALAETFCLNCGMLALDEPTTNLDRDNIESLATSLVEIIEARRSQSNFQLVVITHDEDFIELLGRSGVVDHFYRISKNEKGNSRIMKTAINDIH